MTSGDAEAMRCWNLESHKVKTKVGPSPRKGAQYSKTLSQADPK